MIITGIPIVDNAILVAIVIIALVTAVKLALRTYSIFYMVVPPEQVHVVVNKKGKTIYRNSEGYKTTYWYFPWWMTRNILPLEQIPIQVDRTGLSLHDVDRIPFRADVIAWLVVSDPVIASERVGNLVTDEEYRTIDKEQIVKQVSSRLAKDIDPLIKSVTRTASLKTTLIDIMQDRKKFASHVESDLDVSLREWGLHLTALEVLHIEDVQTDTVGGELIRGVIRNWELQETKKIDTDTRILLATKDKEARLTEAEMKKDAELAEAQNEETSRKRQIEKEESIAIREQEKNLAIQEKTREANIKQVEAQREIEVGMANYRADAKVQEARGDAESEIKKAEGTKQSVQLNADAGKYRKLAEAEAEATYTRETGKADADKAFVMLQAQADGKKAGLLAEAEGIKAKLLGEAEGTDQLADAQKKLQEGATVIKTLETLRDIEIAKYTQLAQAVGQADTKIYAGGIAEILGVQFSPAQGAGLGVTLQSLMDNLDEETKMKVQKSLGGILGGKTNE